MTTKNEVGLRERLRILFEPYQGDPDQPRAGLYVKLFILGCIVLSTVAVVVEHFHEVDAYPLLHKILLVAEVVFTVIFTVEYVVRWYASPNRLRYPFTLLSIIDVIAIVPSILFLMNVWGIGAEFLALRAIRGVRMLRLLRLLRLLKFLRHGYTVFRLIVNVRIWFSGVSYRYHLRRLWRLQLWVLVAWFLGANLLYVEEYLSNDSTVGPYTDSYWMSYWNAIIILVSGMDTDPPLSIAGRVTVTVLLVAGICVVGMFTGEIVSIVVRSAQRSGRMALKPPDLHLEHHVVILGRNRNLENIIKQIHEALGGSHYIVVVCPDAEELPSPGAEAHRRVFGLAGDPSRDDVLTAAGVEKALRVIVLSCDQPDLTARDKDNAALMHALACVSKNPSIPLVVELQEAESLRYASALDTAECLVTRHFGERLISQAVVHRGMTQVYEDLMTLSKNSNEFYSVPVPSFLVGRTVRDAQEHFLDQDGEAISLMGIETSAAETQYREFRLCVADESGVAKVGVHVLTGTDRLIVMAYDRPSFAPIDQEDLWTGKLLARS